MFRAAPFSLEKRNNKGNHLFCFSFRLETLYFRAASLANMQSRSFITGVAGVGASSMRRCGLNSPWFFKASHRPPCLARITQRMIVPQRIAQRSGLRRAFSSSASGKRSSAEWFAFAKRYPFATQATVACLKTGAADVMVQVNIEGKSLDEIDMSRTGLFFLFGFAYLGVAQWGIYVIGFQRVFKEMNRFCNQPWRQKMKNKLGMKQLFGQIAADFIVIQPLVYWPVFYVFKEYVSIAGAKGKGMEPKRDEKSLVARAMEKYKEKFWVDNLGMCGFWLPADLIIYSVPVWLRLPLNHAISFCWCTILSFYRGGEQCKVDENGESATDTIHNAPQVVVNIEQ